MFYLSNYVGSTFNVITVSGDTIKQSNPDSYVTINPNQEDLDINIVFKTKYTHGCVLVSGSLSNADVTTFNQ